MMQRAQAFQPTSAWIQYRSRIEMAFEYALLGGSHSNWPWGWPLDTPSGRQRSKPL